MHSKIKMIRSHFREINAAMTNDQIVSRGVGSYHIEWVGWIAPTDGWVTLDTY